MRGAWLFVPAGVVAAVAASAGADRVRSQDPEGIAAVVAQVEELNSMRSSLARAFGEQGVPADRETFRQVCRPVGMRARAMAEEYGWVVQQLAEKHRNPANDLDQQARSVYEAMLADPDLMGVWRRSDQEDGAGLRYFRRIVVEEACLACHGARDARPDFVVEGYPEDRAYDFQVGDLRGIYSVFVPDAD